MEKKKTNSNDNLVIIPEGKNITESYIFATSRRNFSVFSERLIMQILKFAQIDNNKNDNTNLPTFSKDLDGKKIIDIPITSIMGGKGRGNYQAAKDAVQELMHSPYSAERPKLNNGKQVINEFGEKEYEYISYQILNSCEVNVKPGIITVETNEKTWEIFSDFSKGFKRFNLEIALKLRKKSSIRLYRLLCNQTKPIPYKIDDLKKMMAVEDKYPDNSTFIKQYIQLAKEEIDSLNGWSFNYEVNTSETAEVNKGRVGRKKITSITFFPVSNKQKQEDNMIQEASLAQPSKNPSEIMGKEVYSKLINEFGFSVSEIYYNLHIFEDAVKYGMNLLVFINDVIKKSNDKIIRSPQQYILGAIRNYNQSHITQEIEAYLVYDVTPEPKNKYSGDQITRSKKKPTERLEIKKPEDYEAENELEVL